MCREELVPAERSQLGFLIGRGGSSIKVFCFYKYDIIL